MSKIKAYPNLRKMINIDSSKPVGIGENPEWTLEDHIVNYMARTRRLIRGIENKLPTLLIEKEIELCEERLEEIKVIINHDEDTCCMICGKQFNAIDVKTKKSRPDDVCASCFTSNA